MRRTFDGPVTTSAQADTRRLLEGYRRQMADDWSALLSLVDACRRTEWTPLLTHGDGGGSNVIVGPDGRLYLIDWDSLILGPAERDTWSHLNDDDSAAAFLELYRRAFPDYRADPLRHRYYVFRRFFEDLAGYLHNILESPSAEHQVWNLAELEDTCFRWLWPAMRG